MLNLDSNYCVAQSEQTQLLPHCLWVFPITLQSDNVSDDQNPSRPELSSPELSSFCSSLLANQNSKFRLFLRLVRTNRFAVWSAAQTLLPLLCGYRSGSCSSRRHLIVCGCYSVGTCYSRGLNAFVFSSELRDIDFLRSRLHPSCLYSSSSSHSRPQCFYRNHLVGWELACVQCSLLFLCSGSFPATLINMP